MDGDDLIFQITALFITDIEFDYISIPIIVKNGESFTAPASDGLTRPDGNTGSYFKWRDSNGKLYAPGDNVPADVTRLTAQFDSDTYTVTIITEGGGTASNLSRAKAVAGTEITLTATPNTGYHFKEWEVMSGGVTIKDDKFPAGQQCGGQSHLRGYEQGAVCPRSRRHLLL